LGASAGASVGASVSVLGVRAMILCLLVVRPVVRFD
jgi:hypothetical protein